MRIPKIIKYALLGTLLFLFAVRIMFNFDARKEQEMQFIEENPASMIVESSVDQPIRFLAMQFGKPPSDIVDLSNGFRSLTTTNPYYLPLTQTRFDEASKGNFMIKAECGDKKDWIIDGHKLKREVTTLKVTVFISSCDP